MSQIRVMIVEDMSIIALGVKSKLRRMGYEIVGAASSGEEAVAMAAATRPDVILMDINLKGMDGVTAAQAILRDSEAAIIFTSAYSDLKTRERVDGVAAAGFISKPYEDRRLCQLIDEAAGRSGQTANTNDTGVH